MSVQFLVLSSYESEKLVKLSRTQPTNKLGKFPNIVFFLIFTHVINSLKICVYDNSLHVRFGNTKPCAGYGEEIRGLLNVLTLSFQAS